VWGSDDVNIEGWKALKRLPGHESGTHSQALINLILLIPSPDVTDLAWSPDDRYLASVGLDSMVIVWCGLTLRETFYPVSLLHFQCNVLPRVPQSSSSVWSYTKVS